MKLLNNMLYQMLKYHFSEVHVTCAGEAMQATYRRHAVTKEWYLDIEHPGEYYVVCCPLCGDTRFRLNINHRWGVTDEKGHINLWLAICFNEKCLESSGGHDRRVELWETIVAGDERLSKAKIAKGKEIPLEDIKADWPGPCTRLDLLPGHHKAYQYVLGRGFDPAVIGKFHNVHYCEDSVLYLARHRLIIPIYHRGELKGWQARFVGDLDWKKVKFPPKYYTMRGTPRRSLLYNLANASKYETGVIVEGPTDVWSLGPMAVCTLGATMTQPQRQDFVKRFKHHSAVLCYDPEEFEKPAVKKLVTALHDKFDGGFACIKLPAGTDPGSLARPLLRNFIAEQAKQQGVQVSWKMRT